LRHLGRHFFVEADFNFHATAGPTYLTSGIFAAKR